MISDNTNNNESSFTTKTVKPRYIIVRENVLHALRPHSLKIYMTLRFDAEYRKDVSSIKRNVTYLSKKTGISRRQCFYSFKELESHGLLKIESNRGYQSVYWVAEDMGTFSKEDDNPPSFENGDSGNISNSEENIEAKTDLPPVQAVHRSVQEKEGGMQNVHEDMQNMHNIINISSNNILFSKEYKADFDKSSESPNLSYSQSDGKQGKNEKSDYKANQIECGKNGVQVIETENKYEKSDYFDNKTKNKPVVNKIIPYELKNIQEENIFSIPEQIIHDWIANRKKKRAPITQTAWNKINKELTKCKEQGIDPVDAFETMVASGWQSMKVEYFNNHRVSSAKPKVNNMDTSWGNQVFKPFNEIDFGI